MWPVRGHQCAAAAVPALWQVMMRETSMARVWAVRAEAAMARLLLRLSLLLRAAVVQLLLLRAVVLLQLRAVVVVKLRAAELLQPRLVAQRPVAWVSQQVVVRAAGPVALTQALAALVPPLAPPQQAVAALLEQAPVPYYPWAAGVEGRQVSRQQAAPPADATGTAQRPAVAQSAAPQRQPPQPL